MCISGVAFLIMNPMGNGRARQVSVQASLFSTIEEHILRIFTHFEILEL